MIIFHSASFLSVLSSQVWSDSAQFVVTLRLHVFFFVFRSPHRVSSDTDLAQRRIRTSCVYVTHLILWSGFSVRLSTIPVAVTTNSSFFIRRSLDAGATSFSGRVAYQGNSESM